MAHTIVTIAGSLRKESFSLKIANALAKLAPASLKLDVVTPQGISFFNQDLEANPPTDWLAFREKIQKSDGVLFVTPEYNRAIPGVLKNAIDWVSRFWDRRYHAGCLSFRAKGGDPAPTGSDPERREHGHSHRSHRRRQRGR